MRRGYTSIRLPGERWPMTLALTPEERQAARSAAQLAGHTSLNPWVLQQVERAAAGHGDAGEAAAAAGFALPTWVRLVVLAASGHTTLLEQLDRVRPAK